jgi:hypothetical protein
VTSARAGYAMKGADRRKMLGAVAGKALEPLENGTGKIQVLVTPRQRRASLPAVVFRL